MTRNNLHDLDVAFPLGVFTDRDRRFGLRQVEPREPGARGAGREAARSRGAGRRRGRRRSSSVDARRCTTAGASPAAWRRSSGWCASTRSRSAARRDRTSRRTRVCSTTCASCSRRRRRRARGTTTPAGSRSTSRKAAARHCEGEGFVCVELLFLPSVYAPCPTCHGARYNAKTLEITYRRQEHRRGARR